jgi:hypothetical protein
MKNYIKGEVINFDLTEAGDKCTFKYEKDLTVRCYEATKTKVKKGVVFEESEFCRKIGFDNGVAKVSIT